MVLERAGYYRKQLISQLVLDVLLATANLGKKIFQIVYLRLLKVNSVVSRIDPMGFLPHADI